MEENDRRNGSLRLGMGMGMGLMKKVHTEDTVVVEIDDDTDQILQRRRRRQSRQRLLHELLEEDDHKLCRLSERQMKSLLALTDTILPSIKPPPSSQSSSLSNFYSTSASMPPTPHRLGVLISEKLKHPNTWLLRLTLWLLSTWFGTFILSGIPSITTSFPFFHTFHQLPLHNRQQIMQSWSLSYFRLLRMLFRTIKLLTLLVFFTQVDESGENQSWNAIGYSGPDPDFKSSKENDTNVDGEEAMGPLYKGVVHLNSQRRESIAESLRTFGFCVSLLSPRKESSISSPSLSIECDAVVIGSGSGGGVVAGVLAKAGYKVLVLEKGGYSARNNLSLLEGPSMDEMYLSNGLVATDDMSVLILAGSTVGGGSAINWSASIKTPKHVCKEWCEKHELELFESELYKEAMEVVCEKMGVQCEVEEEGLNNAVLRKGCEEMGYPVSNIPRNAKKDHYCGWCCFGCKDGRKKGTSETWLVDLVKSGNGAILPSCEAIQVLHKKKRGGARRIAKGVAFQFVDHKGSKEICVVESKVTIVACGALCTPPLLKRSGLKNPNIGRHLHLHPVAMAWGSFPNTDTDTDTETCFSSKKSYEGGIMTAMSTVVADIDKSGYGALIQTPALHPGMFSILMPWTSGADVKERMRKFSRTAHVFALARDQGSGTVKSASNIRYQMKDVDKENLRRGMEKVLRILAGAGAEEIGTHHNKGRVLNVKKVSYKELEKFVREESSRIVVDDEISTPYCSAHQMGSCRMGNDPKGSVVNQMGETWEVEGLYVADTSVFPTALGVNPMVTVQAIAYCTAQSLLQLLKRKM
ncbi:hypothetical protein HN51_000932 [Arachis hypogaea]|uniref:long-chain-alcohol oxidase n=2 Tax=Arachis TaxID=3817 RepID=A0A6P4CGX8_ARADU|nr:long-chain-alcohol oxidase FAO4A isoform X1 [Arachis duranensis]XP_025696670.1 long-chain-alcohol oxidase FAO4A [Arachis hypogaea]XP_052114775.1 long-chain-alcohol oxidase FAO4A-like isoform X1 [Arachis duranensis]QHO48939.1 Long-chain-alcohol oxidase FAO4A [Arachis hypogaea]RYR78920.1 hypothetical protein Ahy_A01g003787 [Arachis hypogaea]